MATRRSNRRSSGSSSEPKQYRAVLGLVQFEPREGNAGGKDVRNVVIRNVGFGQNAQRVSLTLWPSHEDVEVGEGDLVFAEGTYTSREVPNEESGEVTTYHNLSVSNILVLGQPEAGERVGVANSSDDASDDDDIPY